MKDGTGGTSPSGVLGGTWQDKSEIETIKNLRTFVTKSDNADSELLAKINELESEVKDKKYGIVYEKHNEETDIILENNAPVLIEDNERILSKDESNPWNF